MSSHSVLLTGATGYVGGELLPRLLAAGHDVRALARSPAKADLDDRVRVVKGDVVEDQGLAEALDGVDTAFYLIHSMGRGSGSIAEFAKRDRDAAANFGRAARDAGVERIIYLGGLQDAKGRPLSEHLRSREEVADVLAEYVAQTIHVRAAMVIGGGSVSFKMLEKLVRRLPLMVAPKWVDTRSQPVAIADVVATLTTLVGFTDPPSEVQLGGREALTYREMLSRVATAMDKTPPRMVPTPFLAPGLSSWWVIGVTGIEAGLVRPLVHGLTAETIVTDPPPPGLNDNPQGFDDAVRAALGGA